MPTQLVKARRREFQKDAGLEGVKRKNQMVEFAGQHTDFFEVLEEIARNRGRSTSSSIIAENSQIKIRKARGAPIPLSITRWDPLYNKGDIIVKIKGYKGYIVVSPGYKVECSYSMLDNGALSKLGNFLKHDYLSEDENFNGGIKKAVEKASGYRSPDFRKTRSYDDREGSFGAAGKTSTVDSFQIDPAMEARLPPAVRRAIAGKPNPPASSVVTRDERPASRIKSPPLRSQRSRQPGAHRRHLDHIAAIQKRDLPAIPDEGKAPTGKVERYKISPRAGNPLESQPGDPNYESLEVLRARREAGQKAEIYQTLEGAQKEQKQKFAQIFQLAKNLYDRLPDSNDPERFKITSSVALVTQGLDIKSPVNLAIRDILYALLRDMNISKDQRTGAFFKQAVIKVAKEQGIDLNEIALPLPPSKAELEKRDASKVLSEIQGLSTVPLVKVESATFADARQEKAGKTETPAKKVGGYIKKYEVGIEDGWRSVLSPKEEKFAKSAMAFYEKISKIAPGKPYELCRNNIINMRSKVKSGGPLDTIYVAALNDMAAKKFPEKFEDSQIAMKMLAIIKSARQNEKQSDKENIAPATAKSALPQKAISQERPRVGRPSSSVRIGGAGAQAGVQVLRDNKGTVVEVQC